MQCIFATKNLEQCSRNCESSKTFFCKQHKDKLLPVNKFHFSHSGNIDLILKDDIIKTAKSANVRSSSSELFGDKNKKFNQTFFTFFFPENPVDLGVNYGSGNGMIQVKPSIFGKLSNMNIKMHYVSGTYPGGLCHKDYCIEWDNKKNVKENLNRMHQYSLLERIKEHSEYKKSKEEIREILQKIYADDYVNEFVVESDIPLNIDGKSYIEKVIDYRK
jgi:hypothetical protein